MEIVDKVSNVVPLYKIDVGEIYKYKNTFYVKLTSRVFELSNTTRKLAFNCAAIGEDYSLGLFSDETEVIPVKKVTFE